MQASGDEDMANKARGLFGKCIAYATGELKISPEIFRRTAF